jgi:hypothetical protein
LKCGTWFQRVNELDSESSLAQLRKDEARFLSSLESRTQLDASDEEFDEESDNSTASSSSSLKQPSKRKLNVTGFEEDDIRSFRRIRLLHSISSSLNNSQEMDQENLYKGFLDVLQKLNSMTENVAPFLAPVNLLEAPDYHEGE